MKLGLLLFIILTVFLLSVQLSCSKTGTSLPPRPPDPCSFVSISLSGSVINPSASGTTDGSITVSASGSSGFTFNINNRTFQSTGVFNNLGAGNYTVIARNNEGCTGTVSFTLINPTVQCSGVNIVVVATATDNIPCEADTASITVVAAGGIAPYTFSLNGGAYQPFSKFYGLAAGSYSVTVKDAGGCVGSGSVTVNNKPLGPLFAQVKGVIQYSCISCHNNTNAQGGVNFTTNCSIVLYKDRIKERAVDGNPSPMPVNGLLSVNDRQKITNWINAGGKIIN
jgi:SprB repeat